MIVALLCLVSFGQSSKQSTDDFYVHLEMIADKQCDLENNANHDAQKISAVYDQGIGALDDLPIPENARMQYLVDHISTELIEIQKREIIVNMMLHRLADEKVQPSQVQPFANFLKQQSENKIEVALYASLIKMDENGAKIFSTNQPTWAMIIDKALKSENTKKQILTEYVLGVAENRHWKPYGSSIFPEWNGADKEEMSDVMLAAQKSIIARQFIEESLKGTNP
jgi:hypothetical protein